MLGEDALHPLQLVLDADDVARQLLDGRVVLKRQRGGDGLRRVDPADPGAGQREQEILEPGAAAELAVGHDLQADALLQPDGVDDRLVFERLRAGIIERPGDLAVLIAFGRRAGLQQVGRAQQAADVLGSKRWCGAHERPLLSALYSGAPAPDARARRFDKGNDTVLRRCEPISSRPAARRAIELRTVERPDPTPGPEPGAGARACRVAELPRSGRGARRLHRRRPRARHGPAVGRRGRGSSPVGPGATRFKPGDRVMALFNQIPPGRPAVCRARRAGLAARRHARRAGRAVRRRRDRRARRACRSNRPRACPARASRPGTR